MPARRTLITMSRTLQQGDAIPRTQASVRRPTPLSRAIALALAASGAMGSAHAQQAFSPAWFAAKGAAQSTAVASGRLPGGAPASSLDRVQRQQLETVQQRLQHSLTNLNTAAQAIALQQSLQARARQAAQGVAEIPDGLAEGGLKVDENALTRGWHNAEAPQQTVVDGRTTITIEQTAERAVLNWETFNVGRNTTVDFQQQSDWAVLNRVNDPHARPSEIQGRIKADGTVMIANRNGVVFSGTSQVNTRNLVAAATRISDSQFTERGLHGANIDTPTFTDASGAVIVQQGAQITTHKPQSVTQSGGYVMLLGTEVENAGEIATPNGQTLLAAGDSFIIRKGVGTDANTASTTRGSEISPRFLADRVDEDGNLVPNPSGKVVNRGLITAREGDITLAGRDVRQEGVAVSTTTVNTRGTLHLLSSASDSRGSVTLGADATTAILIEDDGETTALDSQRDTLIKESATQDSVRRTSSTATFDNYAVLPDRRDQSRIEIVSGGDVVVEGDSLALATGGQIAVSATRRVFVADRAQLDASGAVGVSMSMESNNVLLNVQGNELRDSPLNRDSGALFNRNVWVDRRNLVLVPAGTGGGYESDRWYTAGGLLEAGGYVSTQGHTIGEWAAQGGTIALVGNEIITQAGSAANVAGGSLDVQTGYVNATWLRATNGSVYMAGEAPTDLLYTGVYVGYESRHERWDVRDSYFSPLLAPQRRLENGYTVGRDAGTLIVSAPTAVLEGDVIADVFNGERQTRGRDAIADSYRQSQTAHPRAGAVTYGQYGYLGLMDAQPSAVLIGRVEGVTAGMSVTDALAEDRIGTAWLDAEWITRTGLGGLSVATSQMLTVDAPVTLADGGQLSLVAPTIDLDASITAHGGDIFASHVFRSHTSTGDIVKPLGSGETGISITLDEGAVLDVTGRWVNVLIDPEDYPLTAFIDGGSVHLESNVNISSGSLIDASSGAAVLADGSVRGGRGGDVTLIGGDTGGSARVSNGVLTLDGDIRAYGMEGGGTLSLEAGSNVVIGGGTPLADGAVEPFLELSSDLFTKGFSRYDVSSSLSVLVNGDIDAVMPVYRPGPDSLAAVSGTTIGDAAELWLPPTWVENPIAGTLRQRAGASVAISALHSVALTQDATIDVDPGQSVAIQSHGQTTIDGTIRAPGGAITIASDLDARLGDLLPVGAAGQSIWIGEHARLDVAAETYAAVDIAGHRYGAVTKGGSIMLGLSSMTPDEHGVLPVTQSTVIVRPGAVLDASGGSVALDLPSESPSWTATDVASDGGSILIGSMNGLFLDGELLATAGGTGAAGGSLTLALENAFMELATTPVAVLPRVLTVTAERTPSGLPPDLTAAETDPNIPYGTARISAEQITAGGFDDLTLWSRDVLSFDGAVNLTMERSLALYRGVLSAASEGTFVTLSAPHVLLDGAVDLHLPQDTIYRGLTLQPWMPAATNHGSLRIEADLIDVRNRVWSGFNGSYASDNSSGAQPPVSQPFEAAGFGDIGLFSRGDIRFGTGVLATGGKHITLEATQIYPTTGAVATVAAGMVKNAGFGGGYQGSADSVITVRGNGNTSTLPQSVFGSLGLVASTIDQGGVLRAPLGTLVLGGVVGLTPPVNPNTPFGVVPPQTTITLRDGSVTSTSAAGLVMPYGGTVDGLSYTYNGTEVNFPSLASVYNAGRLTGVTLVGERIISEPGSMLDLSGGGELTGAGFLGGRGGSVDVLRTPLVNANPTNTYSSASNEVYAIVPGYAADYAPLQPDSGAGAPRIGQQITLSEAVGGLAAGTYTLLPSTYALLPGAWRIEIGASTPSNAPVALGNGSYVARGTLGYANTAIRASLPNEIVLTPAQAVRTYSQYNETGYSDFAKADAALFGLHRPQLPADAHTLLLDYKTGTGDILSFDGQANFTPAENGFAGRLVVETTYSRQDTAIEIKAAGTQATEGMASFDAEDLSRFNAGTLLVGGTYSFFENTDFNALTGPRIFFNAPVSPQALSIFVRDGATLQAGQIFLIGTNRIAVEGGAVLDTTQNDMRVFDSTAGYVFANSFNDDLAQARAILAVANGRLDFLPSAPSSTGTITIGDGAALRTLGTIAFTASQGLELGSDVALNARYLSLSLPEINVGTEASLDAARNAGALGTGWSLTQSALDRLIAPTDPTLPGVERLTLASLSSLNFFGDVSLDVHGGDGEGAVLILNTPAIYGWGGDGDVANLTADTLIWNGLSTGQGTDVSPYVSVRPGALRPGGAGTGSSTLRIDAREIVFGYAPGDQYQDETALDRLALGFATIDLVASERITANNRGTLSVYRSGSDAQSHAGGDLNLITPLLTTEAGAYMTYTAGGAIAARAPAAVPADDAAESPTGDTTQISALGGELHLDGDAVSIDTSIGLPSGRLVLAADGDITLTDRARVDLSGRSITFFDVTKHSWGGDVDIHSASGRVMQAAGSVLDVSSSHNEAGSITVKAVGTGGSVALHGTLLGDGAEGYDDGSFDVRAPTLTDFAELNGRLNEGGFFAARSFAVATGDLIVGDEVRANRVNLSTDGGSLIVNGTIDASGAAPGTIRLSARDDLTLASTAVLDAHGTELQVDASGAPIEALNRGHVELTSMQGRVALASGSEIDLSTRDGIARGQIEINARRLGGNDVAVDASTTLDVRGAASIAVNGFRRYELADGGIIDQHLLDGIHGDSSAFIDAALANGDLEARLAGLQADGASFHLRPGVEIWSEGDIATRGDLDFSGYRYGPQADPALRGSGEPGVVWVRAGSDFAVNGSISDGFAPPPSTPDDHGWILLTGGTPTDIKAPAEIVLPGSTSGAATSFSLFPGLTLDFDIPIRGQGLKANAVIPVAVTLSGAATLPAGYVVKGDITLVDGTVLPAGATIAATTQLPTGTRIGAGNALPSSISIGPMIWPAGAPLDIFASGVTLSAPVTVAAGTVIPAGVNIPRIGTINTAMTLSEPTVLLGGPSGTVTTFRNSVRLPFSITIRNAALRRGIPIPFAFTLQGAALTVPSAWVTTARIFRADGSVVYEAGATVPANTALPNGTRFAAGSTIPAQGTATLNIASGAVIPANTLLSTYFSTTQLALNESVLVPSGTTLPALTNVQNAGIPLRPRSDDGTMGRMYAIAPMLAPGMQSWSMRYVAGADLGAADSRSTAFSGTGDLVLSDVHYHFGGSLATQQAISVLRTGTGYLDLLAQGDYRQESVFGVYSAGTQKGGVLRAPVTVSSAFAAALNPVRFYFTEGGGDLLLSVGGDLLGHAAAIGGGSGAGARTDAVGNWSLTGDGNWGIDFGSYDLSSSPVLRGFAGIGTLGGGNLSLKAGGDAGGRPEYVVGATATYYQGLTVAVGSGRRTGADGTQMFGGGDLTIDIAGRLNPYLGEVASSSVTNLRGDIDLRAASVGNAVAMQFGKRHDTDPRAPELTASYGSRLWGQARFSLGDGSLIAHARSDLLAQTSTVGDLWTDTTSSTLFSAGGDVAPTGTIVGASPVPDVPSVSVIAAGGNILLGSSQMAPSPVGQLELLAWNTINGRGNLTSSGLYYWTLQPGDLAEDLHIEDFEPIRVYAVNGDILSVHIGQVNRLTTGVMNVTNIAGKHARILAGRDIVGLNADLMNNRESDVSMIAAGRDIIYANAQIAGPGTLEVTAGRNIYQGDSGNLSSIGPLVEGDLRRGADIAVMAGAGAGAPGAGNVPWMDFARLYLDPANQADSQLPLADQPGKVAKTYQSELAQWLSDRYGFRGTQQEASTYFAALSPEQQRIFLRQVYFAELLASGREYNDPESRRFGSYLRGRNVIAVLFPERDAAGNAIERAGDLTLFQGAQNNSGIRTLSGGSIQTLVPNGRTTLGISGVLPATGGTPMNPVPLPGLLTQGEGDIGLYSKGSILLGLSRIMTTFGGDIQAWSAEGDINAGRGAKTTIVYTPARRAYDDVGNAEIAPQVPSTGAGIATLNPIPEVPAGDVDLIAPLGTIDAGEAGIRVSGDLNIAALQVLNAENIQVKGERTGLPMVAAVDVGALTNASAAATQASVAAQDLVQRQRAAARQVLPSIFSVRVLGFGNEPTPAAEGSEQTAAPPESRDGPIYNSGSAFQLLGVGGLTPAQRARLTEIEQSRLPTTR